MNDLLLLALLEQRKRQAAQQAPPAPVASGGPSDVSQGLAASKLAGAAARGIGNFTSSSPLASVGSGLGTAAGLAGAGYNLYNIAANPNLSTDTKVGAGIQSGGEAAASLAFGPYGALPAIATALGGQLQKSGSPELRGTGRGLSAAGQPIPTNPFSKKNVENPVPELKGLGQSLLEGGPGVSAILKAVGFDPFAHTPTHGTMLRSEIDRIAGQIPELKGFKMQRDVLTPEQYNAYAPEVRNTAYSIADSLGKHAPDYKRDPKAYQIQLGNSLLKAYSPDQLAALAGRLGVG